MKLSWDIIGEVYTSDKIIWRGQWEIRVDLEKECLWLLLLQHALHEKSKVIEKDESKL